jgi:pectinesterase
MVIRCGGRLGTASETVPADKPYLSLIGTGSAAAVNANRPRMTAATYVPTAYLAGSDRWNPIR